jgi:4a-hydroxytetrahydrobiopterin dehydratase
MKNIKMNLEEINNQLKNLPGWQFKDNFLIRKFKFNDFNEAFTFMTAVAAIANEADHHPNWSNVYNQVDISLTTHDLGGVSQRDILLASAINELVMNFSSQLN